MDCEITEADILYVVKHLKRDESTGLDSILNEVLTEFKALLKTITLKMLI